jgi:hypothetical protein
LGLSIGAISTYWDFIHDEDNFYIHGLFIGVAAIPLLWCGVPWWIVYLRMLICSIGMGLWSKFIKRDVPQEIGRGILFIL